MVLTEEQKSPERGWSLIISEVAKGEWKKRRKM